MSLWLFSSPIEPGHFATENCRLVSFYLLVRSRAHTSASLFFARLAISLVGLCLVSSASAADFVIHISVDGLRPDYMQSLINNGNAPNFKRFQTEGAWTNNARTDYTHTITLPNHTSMLTGRPVSQPAGMPSPTQHGYTDNGDPAPTTTLHNFTNPDYYKASTFDVAARCRAFDRSVCLEEQVHHLRSELQRHDRCRRTPTDATRSTRSLARKVTATMQSQLLADLAANHFNYTFVHYADTDDAGHGSGWGSTAWNNALITIDGYLGQLFNLIETDATLAGQTAIVLSADHGGTGTGHSTATDGDELHDSVFCLGSGRRPRRLVLDQ